VNRIRAILVDDEESARDVLENLLLRFCTDVELLKKCENIPQAVEAIKELQPDLVFLDIEMPQYAGFEIARFFDEMSFHIIFVTAYDRYAIRAFDLAAIDYLLKPVDIPRLKLAVERAHLRVDSEKQTQRIASLKNNMESQSVSSIIVSDKNQQHLILASGLIAIEAQESYCILHTTDKAYLASKNLKHFETILESNPDFFRVHKSWIINKKHLKHYSKSELNIYMSNGIITRLSKYKKTEFEAALLC
jgi:two-component system LytT family response regulator